MLAAGTQHGAGGGADTGTPWGRLKEKSLEGSTWKIWWAPGEDWKGPNGPGFNQRFIGEISADGKMIEGRWERGMGAAGDEWGIDFPINYFRK
jgi:hypothetical protein